MDVETIAERALRLVPRQLDESPQTVKVLSGLVLLRHHRRTAFESTIYEPVFCLIVQGRKEVTLGGSTFEAGAGRCLVVSHDLPVLSRVTRAPYLSLLLDIDLATLRGLHDELADARLDAADARAMETHDADEPLLDALGRYLALAGSGSDAKVLGPLILKEIHYRVLMSPSGAMLRRLLRRDSYESAIGRAISHIRRDFRAPIAVSELAEKVGMSPASFHKHFKEITTTTPLQYQKELRLLQARRLLAAGSASVSTVAFDVGYESASQFSREYARRFGVPPSRDAAERTSAAP
ncbi:AraC family transcriptional regulator [Sandaracinus amylolyticus]|uniref:Transcriptional regulator, AraC family protein n=1 Tax=Sandaracinus amylolyticus TaxID=927083 RepID=A0A0F6YFE5_9BACT|nr:AraC family transcriptional regulator [Sandaracinus amylolyticus]AKF03532.1 Transcriptional regulator, AraC family protein [Sandaracinus amylolyticus]